MNTINFFNSRKKFPVSTETFDFLQNTIKLLGNLAKVGGSTYILDGCEQNGSICNSGYVVINGELLPFMGGPVQTKVRIREIKTDVVAGYDTYMEAYTVRQVEFGSNLGDVDTFTWSSFNKLKSNAEIVANFATKAELDAVRLLVMPKGAIIEFDINNNPVLPIGWCFCNGDNLDGYGKIPDKRGRVTLGFDPDATNTPVNVTDERNSDGSVIHNYGKVGNTGGKHSVRLTGRQSGVQYHVHPEQFQGNPAQSRRVQSGTSFYVLGQPDINPVANIGNTGGSGNDDALEDHENRMAYTVGYFIVKIV